MVMRVREEIEYLIGKAGSLTLATVKGAVQALEPRARGHRAPGALLIGGVQRSGTTMLLDVLDRSFQTRVYREYDPQAFENYELRSVQIIYPLVREAGVPWVCFKALCESHCFASLLEALAPARAIWIVRGFEDVVNSHIAIWTGMPRSIALIVGDRDSAGWRGRGMSDTTLERVRAVYRPGVSNASACALFWYFRNVLFFEQGLDRDERVLLARYEDLVTRPDEDLRRIFSALSLRYTPWVARRVFASSMRKRPAPAIDPAIRELCEGLTARFDALSPPGGWLDSS